MKQALKQKLQHVRKQKLQQIRKQKWIIPSAIAAAIMIAAVILLGIFANSGKGFLRQTTWLGMDVAGITPEQAAEKAIDLLGRKELTFNEEGQAVLSGKLSDYGLQIDSAELKTRLETALKAQSSSLATRIGSLFGGLHLKTDLPYLIDQSTLDTFVSEMNFKIERVAGTAAALSYDENAKQVVVKPATKGNEIEIDKLRSLVRKELEAQMNSLDSVFDNQVTIPEEVYIDTESEEDLTALQSQADLLNEYTGAKITYQFGNETKTLEFAKAFPWFTVSDGKVGVDAEQVQTYVSALAKEFNTRKVKRTFRTSHGTDVEIPANLNSYGYRIDETKEIAQIQSDLLSKKEVTREPKYVEKASYDNPYYYTRNGKDDLNGTYVEIDLTNQHLWFYKAGKLVVETDFVSGNISKQWDTTTGAFPLAYKKSPAVLSPSTGEGNTPVNYWMPFYDGQGLHDAIWRSKFGGEIYKTNGSHGCINLPLDATKQIYDNIQAGVAIILYK